MLLPTQRFFRRFRVRASPRVVSLLCFRELYSCPLQYSRDCRVVPCVLNLRASGECQMGLPTGRMEKRSVRAVAVELSSPELSHAPETTFTENVSLHGVRVVTRQPWRVGDRLLVKSLEGDFRSQARVTYCQHLPNNALAVGLELFTHAEEWGSPSNST